MHPDTPSPLQRRGTWLLALALAAFAAALAFRLLFLVEPGLNVDITFSRQQALEAAAAFQQQRFAQLATQRTAAAFVSDRDFQNYVELEAGGAEAYQALIPELAAATHYWRVRAFRPGQKHELLTSFSPGGELIAFSYLLPEDEGSARLDETAARSLAEAGAQELLGERFAAYLRVETQQESQPMGRLDHEFTYEHGQLQPGDARLRLTLRVAGDQLVAVETGKFTPEAFRQRFGELRALNTQLSQIANGLMLGVFGLGGLLGGGIWLYRRHQLLFRQGLVPALVVSLGLGAAQIANMPILWMSYQTQTAEQSFKLMQVAQAGLVIVVAGLLFGAIYAVAEGLTRHAFAQQPRLWDSLRTPVAGSSDLLGRVLGGYVWTGFFLLYALGFLLFSSRILGWWQPASLNVDPNVLASWRPALAPVFNALQAGTWEECFFRAIPLSIAVLLDRRFGSGRRITWLMLMFQALVFGAAHASYPQLPGYSRVVELFIPAMAFGLVFLRFGLVPCMITHFIYDLSLMSMPIFLAQDGSLWLDRLLVLLAGATPLLAALLAWRRQGSLQALPVEYRNGEPPAPPPAPTGAGMAPAAAPVYELAPLPLPRLWLRAGALVSLALFIVLSLRGPRLDWPQFDIDRSEALQLATAALQQRGVTLEGEWRASVQVLADARASLDFVWRESGTEETQRLLGSYVEAPQWLVRWRRFDGPVEERAETWQVYLTAGGELLQIAHQLPEGRPGASLDQAEAEALARSWVDQQGWTPASGLGLRSIAETRRPARSDWKVMLEDAAAYAHADAMAVIVVQIAGDEVTGYARAMDLPESWVRVRAEEASRRQPYRIASMTLTLLLVGCALSSFFRKHDGGRFNLRAALPWLALTLLPLLGLAWLRFDATSLAFQTAMAWNTQVALQLGTMLLAAGLLAALVAMAAQAMYAERPHPATSLRQDAELGLCLALLLLGVVALGRLLLPTQEPPLPLVADHSTVLPGLAVVLNGWRGLASCLFTLVVALGFVRYIRQRWQLWLVLAAALGFWVLGALSQPEPLAGLFGPLPSAGGVLLGYLLIRRGQLGAALVLAGTLVVLRQWSLLQASYPGAWLHAALGFAVTAAALAGLLWHWYRPAVAAAPGAQGPANVPL